MPLKKPLGRRKYVKHFKDRHGVERWYFAYRDFPTVPLPGPEGSTQFIEAYEAARISIFSGNDVKSMAEKRRRDAADREIWGTRTVPKCGVYILMQGAEIVYIGSSTDVRGRVLTHRQYGRPFDSAYAIETEEETRLALEKMLIAALRPGQNKTWVTGGARNPVAQTVQTGASSS